MDFAVIKKGGKEPIGSAFQLDEAHAMTCAHVLSRAGYGYRPGTETIVLRHEGRTVQANLEEAPWLGVTPGTTRFPEEKDIPEDRDFVVLRLKDTRLRGSPQFEDARQSSREVRVFGFPREFPAGTETMARTATRNDLTGLRQLNQNKNEVILREGFSGGAARDGDAILGVLVLRYFPEFALRLPVTKELVRTDPPLAYLIPMSRVSEVLKQHGCELVDVASPLASTYPGTRRLESHARDELSRMAPHREEGFPVKLHSLAEDPGEAYAAASQIHAGEVIVDANLEPHELLGATPRSLFLMGPGGCGKTYLLNGLILSAIEHEVVPFLLSLRQRDRGPKTAQECEALLDGMSSEESIKLFLDWYYVKHHHKHMDKADEDNQRSLILIDGFNESIVPAKRLARIIDDLASQYPSASIVVTDRLYLRSHYPPGFSPATLLPLSDEFLEKIGAPTYPVARVPLYLSFLLSDPSLKEEEKPTKRQAIKRFIDVNNRKAASGSKYGPDELAVSLAELAYHGYSSHLSPEMSATTFDEVTSKHVVLGHLRKDLVAVGLLHKRPASDEAEEIQGPARYEFRHHLVQDYLAALHVSSNPPLEPTKLSTLTLGRKSTDAIDLLAEIIALQGDTRQTDDFIRSVYDWDYPIGVECILSHDALPIGAAMVSDDLRNAVFVLLAEKKFDRFLHTRRKWRKVAPRVEPLLTSLFGDWSSPEKLTSAVSDHMQPSECAEAWFVKWHECYTQTTGLPESTLRLLLGKDPILGWTTANVLRRVTLNASDIRVLRASYLALLEQSLANSEHDSGLLSTVRWRVVHSLGKTVTVETRDFLEKAAWSPLEAADVRHGAARALVELACESTEDRGGAILDSISERLSECDPDPRPLTPFRRCSILRSHRDRESPDWWAERYRPILVAGSALFRGVSDEDKLWDAQLTILDEPDRTHTAF